MIYIDKYAYCSGLKETSPRLKILFGGTSLLACVASRSMISFAVVFATMGCMTVFKGKIPLGYYVKLLSLPLGFLTLGVIGIVVQGPSRTIPVDAVSLLDVRGYSFYVSHSGLRTAALLVAKSMAAVSCLYFIILTTPFRDIVRLARRIKCPKTLLTLSVLIYQFVFLLLDIADTKLKSQRCRGGFRNLKRFPRDFALLWGSVFVQSWLKSQWAFKSMQARGYDGHLPCLPKQDKLRVREWVWLLCFLLLVILPNFVHPVW